MKKLWTGQYSNIKDPTRGVFTWGRFAFFFRILAEPNIERSFPNSKNGVRCK